MGEFAVARIVYIIFASFAVEMPLENFEEEGLAKNPNLELAQWKFMLLTEQYKNDSEIKAKLLDAVKADGAYFLEDVDVNIEDLRAEANTSMPASYIANYI